MPSWPDLTHHLTDILKAAIAAALVQAIVVLASFLEAHVPLWLHVVAPVSAGVAAIKTTRVFS